MRRGDKIKDTKGIVSPQAFIDTASIKHNFILTIFTYTLTLKVY